ncbi:MULTISPECIES: hypothetical protein [Rhodomicrobium]|uniref:hypothetical protein n=1 Tax=Rhodomicrobium TaxID=1068 RepID=UPI000B4C0853|nr:MULTISPECIES: hypothetical protein [Rhodomicrobium]
MAKFIDKEKVSSALKRAAKIATTGPREARSGRFTARDAKTGQFIDHPSRLPEKARAKSGEGDDRSEKP